MRGFVLEVPRGDDKNLGDRCTIKMKKLYSILMGGAARAPRERITLKKGGFEKNLEGYATN